MRNTTTVIFVLSFCKDGALIWLNLELIANFAVVETLSNHHGIELSAKIE